MKRSLVVVSAVLAMISAIVLGSKSTNASGDHVEYTVPPGQQGVLGVVQHGEDGLVEVTLDCIVPGKTFTFVMNVTVPSGSTDLSVRKNSGQDLSGWFSLEPAHVNAPGLSVEVHIDVPSGSTLSGEAVTRIQEVGDPPAPGGHHGVKVRLGCLQSTSTPTPTATPITPTATSTSVPPTVTPTTVPPVIVGSATPTATSVVPTSTSTTVQPTSTVVVPTTTSKVTLPNTGTGPDTSKGWSLGTTVTVAAAAVLFVVIAVLGFLTWRIIRYN